MAVETVTANGLEFGYLQAGSASGPLALCLHGFPDSAQTYRYLLPALAEAGYHAVAPFMRGYAPTQVPADGAYQGGALVADATAMHDAFGGDENAVLVGHDWGAFATYGATAFDPPRWRRAVTIAVPPIAAMMTSFFHYDQLKRSFYMFLFQTDLAEMAASLNDLAFIDGLWRDWSPGYDAAEDLVHVKNSLRDPAHLAAAIGYYRSMLGRTPRQERYAAEQEAFARTAGSPTLYLHGEDDGCLGAELVKDAAAHLPEGSRMEYVDRSGHFLHVERPDHVNARIIDWLDASD